MKVIDLRSDTVTLPSDAMRGVMARAEVGDDVYGEDVTVNRLQEMTAEKLGKEAGLFLPSGTMSNLVALLTHCGRGDEYIAGQEAHCYRWEGGGAAVLGGIQPQPLDFEADGTLDLDKVARAIKPADHHHAVTRLICLENTTGGLVLPLDYLARVREFAAQRGLLLHLDGARLANAAVHLGVPLAELTEGFDSVSFCLSKGLGAPVGSVLCGSREFIERAHRWRKVTGGGLRQAGILAAAGIHALERNIDRLADDHRNAELLAEGLGTIDELRVSAPRTNILYVTPPAGTADDLREAMALEGIRLGRGETIRLVTHLDVSRDGVERTVEAFKRYFAS
ncbi:threonine aldolase [Geomonas sp. Red276]